MKLLDGKASSSAMRANVADAASFLKSHGVSPCLAAVLVGDNPASSAYVASKQKQAEGCGMVSRLIHLPASTPQSHLLSVIDRLNRDRAVHGILLQLPLPDHLNEDAALFRISPLKDVDGLHPENQGLLAAGSPRFVPCTPKGVLHLLDFYQVPVEGREVVVVGRSRLVGRPLALLFLIRHATVTVCHSRTKNLAAVTRRADVLIAAAGKKHLISPRHVKPRAVVVDVGIHVSQGAAGKKIFAGDVSPRVVSVAGALSPVPGGVGPETVAQLLANTVRAASFRLSPHDLRTFNRAHLHRL